MDIIAMNVFSFSEYMNNDISLFLNDTLVHNKLSNLIYGYWTDKILG